ncbi:RNA demethylase ALKBH10B-like [Fagus crenata]
MKGHGREMIQLGLPIADAPLEEDNAVGSSKDRNIESIPSLLQDVIERLVGMQIMTVKPDSCIIDFYNEGDHAQPHMFPPWFGRPICVKEISFIHEPADPLPSIHHQQSTTYPIKETQLIETQS